MKVWEKYFYIFMVEIVEGDIFDTNSNWLCKQITICPTNSYERYLEGRACYQLTSGGGAFRMLH